MTITGIQYRLNQAGQRTAFALRNASTFTRLKISNGNRPSLAAVMVGRNDDYMPDFKQRLQATIAWNIRHLVDEVIFIEWNPPPERELLAYDLTKQFQQVRVYVVPPELHTKVCHNTRLPLMEYHAKNVGIRRATADWVIATNADVALGVDTIQQLKKALLPEEMAFTAERIDIDWKEWRDQEIGLRDCLRYKRIIPYVELGTGDFLLASRALWHKVRGYDEALLKHRIGCDVRGAAQMMSYGAGISKVGTILHLAHPTSCTESVQPHHGEYAPMDGLPYENSDGWGLGDCKEVALAERVWRLE